MDIEIGPKCRRLLIDGGFENVTIGSFMVTNTDGDPQDFADVIASWKNLFAGKMAQERGDSPSSSNASPRVLMIIFSQRSTPRGMRAGRSGLPRGVSRYECTGKEPSE